MRSDPTSNSVVRAFDAAAATYDDASQVQREIARELVFRAARDIDRNPRKILDLGCGAGHVTEAASQQWPEAEIVALDAAPAMLATLQSKFPGVKVICADAADPGAIGPYDLILSSMMLHWLPDPRAALARWRSLLAPGGRLHVALPVEGSLSEWRDACRAAGRTDGLWPFPPRDFGAGLSEMTVTKDFVTLYPDARAFLQSLKRTGARKARPGHRPESPAALRRLLAAHQGAFAATFRIAFLSIDADQTPTSDRSSLSPETGGHQ
jgi:malonyl-CoA O-methyltransferase